MRVANRCSASKGTNTSKRSDRYQCALASDVERIEPPQAGAVGLLSVTTTDALFAEKVQRKVSNGPAENRGNSCQRKHPAEMLALSPSCASHRRSSNANSLCRRNSAGLAEICAIFQRDNLRRHF